MTQSDDSLPVSDPPKGRRRWRWLVIVPLAVIALLATLTLSLAPMVEAPHPPGATSVAAARDVIKQLTGDNARRGTVVRLTISQRELDGLVELASEALAPLRMEAQLMAIPPAPPQPAAAKNAKAPGAARRPKAAPAAALVVRMSRQLPLGAWVNITAHARQASDTATTGLPEIDLKIGRLAVPQWLTHWAITRLWLRSQGDVAAPIELAQVVRALTISPAAIGVTVVQPGRGAAMAGLAQAQGASTDPVALATAYCAIAGSPDADLAALVRRAGAVPMRPDLAPSEHNRALLTAIAMRAVPEHRERLAGAALPKAAPCMVNMVPLTLAGRADLAKHWALSAALTATLGSQVARSMGTWKELADSTDGGTGFSFVDLAADRSGERFAAAAVDPQLARPVHLRLGAITEDQMLPPELLSKPEGLDQAAFERDYSATNSPEYARALRAINRLLGNAGVP